MKDRVVTASIGLKLSTIDEIQKRADKNGTTFSLEGRKIVEGVSEPAPPESDTPEPEPAAPVVVVEKSSAPI